MGVVPTGTLAGDSYAQAQAVDTAANWWVVVASGHRMEFSEW